MAMVKFEKDRVMVALTEEDVTMVREIISEKMKSLFYEDIALLSEAEVNAIDEEYAKLGDLKAKFGYTFFVI